MLNNTQSKWISLWMALFVACQPVTDKASLSSIQISASEHYESAKQLKNSGQLSLALEQYQESLSLSASIDDFDSQSKALNGKANCLKKMGRYSEAILEYQKALDLQQDHALSGKRSIWIHENLGQTYMLMYDFGLAVGQHEQAMKLLQQKQASHIFEPADYPVELAIAGSMLALDYKKWAERLELHHEQSTDSSQLLLHQAKNYYLQSLEALKAQAVAPADRAFESANIQKELSAVYRMLGEYPLAAQCLEACLNLYLNWDEARSIAETYLYLGQLWEAQDSTQKALDYFHKVLQPEISNASTLHFTTWLNIGSCYADDERYEQALSAYENALRLAAGSPSPSIEKMEFLYTSLANLSREMEQPELALAYLQESFQLWQKLHFDQVDHQLSLQRAKLESVNTAAQLAEEQKVLQFALGGSLLVLFGLVMLFLYYRRRQRFEKEMHYKNQVEMLNTHRQELLSTQVQTQEEIFESLSHELHAGLTGLIASSKNQLELLWQSVSSPKTEQQEQYQKTYELIRKSLDSVRSLSHHLNGLHLDNGLDYALKEYCAYWNTLSGVPQINLYMVQIQGKRFAPVFERNIFRIFQEGLNNILKHAEARHVYLQLICNDTQLSLVIEDDGKGFDLQKVPKGLGLRSIETRIAQMKGELTIDTVSGRGTSLFAQIPLDDPIEYA